MVSIVATKAVLEGFGDPDNLSPEELLLTSESSIIAILSLPAFLRRILYVEAWPMILPPVVRN